MIEVWIDGCCYPVNPGGTACAGYVIKKKGLTIAKGSRIIGKGKGMTNNVAEYQALIIALEEIKRKQLYTEEIIIKSDSKLLVNQMNGNWKVKSQLLYPLYREAKKTVAKYNLNIKWIPRELNEEADEMSRVAFTSQPLKENSQKDSQSKQEGIKNLSTFKSFSIEEQAKKTVKSKESINSKEQSKTNRLGETENLIVDNDPSQEMLLLYGKEISDNISFKIGIKKDEINTLIELLSIGKTILTKNSIK